MRSGNRLLAVGACAVALLASARGVPAQKTPTAITFLTNYIFQGRHAPFFLGRDQGFYRDAGFDLNIVPATGSGYMPRFARLARTGVRWIATMKHNPAASAR